MVDEHWFDAWHKQVMASLPRRGFIAAAGGLVMALSRKGEGAAAGKKGRKRG